LNEEKRAGDHFETENLAEIDTQVRPKMAKVEDEFGWGAAATEPIVMD